MDWVASRDRTGVESDLGEKKEGPLMVGLDEAVREQRRGGEMGRDEREVQERGDEGRLRDDKRRSREGCEGKGKAVMKESG